MQNIEIVPIDNSQIIALQSISKSTFVETFATVNTAENMQLYLENELSFDKLQAEVANPNSYFYFAKIESEIVGYLKLNTGNAQTEQQTDIALEIERIYVAEKCIGQNVGKILFEKAVQKAKEIQAKYIWLGVWEDNKRAIQFYEKKGFVFFGSHVFTLGTDAQTDLLMRLAL